MRVEGLRTDGDVLETSSVTLPERRYRFLRLVPLEKLHEEHQGQRVEAPVPACPGSARTPSQRGRSALRLSRPPMVVPLRRRATFGTSPTMAEVDWARPLIAQRACCEGESLSVTNFFTRLFFTPLN